VPLVYGTSLEVLYMTTTAVVLNLVHVRPITSRSNPSSIFLITAVLYFSSTGTSLERYSRSTAVL
jgi:hypothetical protein